MGEEVFYEDEYAEVDIDEDEMETEETPSARPRRMSEITIKEKVKPIPNASSFFIFGPKNPWVMFDFVGRCCSAVASFLIDSDAFATKYVIINILATLFWRAFLSVALCWPPKIPSWLKATETEYATPTVAVARLFLKWYLSCF